jgi:archaellum component FlaC
VDLDVVGSNPITRPKFFGQWKLDQTRTFSGVRSEVVSDERADLILNMLREIRAKQDQHDRKLDELVTRMGSLERDFAGMKMDFAGMHLRLDNMDRRIERIERRLELIEA